MTLPDRTSSMKTKFLTLNKPCHEKWENMTPNERGSFCDSCSKNVIDFTRLNQFEISEIIKKSDGNICARVTNTQLRTPLFNLEPEKKNFSFPYSKVAAGLMLASSLTVVYPVSANMLKVQTEAVQSIATNIELEEDFTESIPKTSTTNDFTVFKGKVVSEEDVEPIENAKITLFTVNKILSTHSYEDGTFSLEIPNNLIDNNNVIRASYFSVKQSRYQEEDYILAKNEMNNDFTIKAEIHQFYFGQIATDVIITNPLVIYKGEKIDFNEFEKAQLGMKSSCNLENKDYYYFDLEAAVALYGEEAKNGLYILTEKQIK